ncbi:hypothetical protein QK268_03140, partial [Treponema pallidum]
TLELAGNATLDQNYV